MSEPRRLPYLFLVAVAAALVGCVLYPLWQPLFLGGVMATALSRPLEWLERKLRGRRGLAATLLTVLCILLIIGPFASIAVIAARQAFDAFLSVRRHIAAGDLNDLATRLPRPLAELVARGRALLPPIDTNNLTEDLPSKLLQGSEWAAGMATGVVSVTSGLAFDLVIMLVTMHVLLVDGRRLVAWLIDVSPLAHAETQSLLVEFKNATRAILTSTLATAAAQGVVATIGYLIAQAPRPIFFGILTFLCAFIPGVGTALVALPMVVYLFLVGQKVAAIFLAIYFVLVVSMVDNLLKPMLMKSGMRMHGAIVFLSLIGGVLMFGGVGLVAGPLALTFFLAMVRLRERV